MGHFFKGVALGGENYLVLISRQLRTQICCWPELWDPSWNFFLECLSGLGLGRVMD